MSRDYNDDELVALQAVLDRITSYQDGATESTVEAELREALADTELDVDDADLARLAAAVEEEHGAVRAADVLG